MSVKVGNILGALFWIWTASLTCAQGAPPDWYSMRTGGPLEDHPALEEVSSGRRIMIRDVCTPLVHGQRFVAWHPMHGELVVHSRANAFLGIVATGLEYVFHVESIRFPVEPHPVIALLVTGVKESGRSCVLHASWPDTTKLEDVTFRSLTPDSEEGERYMSASLVEDRLYVVRGVSQDIAKFVDTTGNGLPDALSPSRALSLTSSEAPRYVFGVLRRYGLDCVPQFPSRRRRRPVYYIVDEGGTLAWRSFKPSKLSRPHLVGHAAIAGLTSLRVRCERGQSIEVKSGGKRLAGVTSLSLGPEVISLPGPLVAGEELVLSDADDSAVVRRYVVEPARPVLFQGESREAAPGDVLRLNGGNLDDPDLRVELSLNEGPFIAVPSHAVGSNVLEVTAPSPPRGPIHRLVLRLVHGGGDGRVVEVKRLVLR